MSKESQSKTTVYVSLIAVAVIFIALVSYFLTVSSANDRLQSLEKNTLELVSEQEAVMIAIAEITARNGADDVTESIIKDCDLPDRGRFDELLSRLNQGLFYNELIELERLFGRCGSFYSERKSIMVSRMDREVDIYKKLVNQLELINGEELSEEYSVSLWTDLVAEEKRQSELFTQLVNIQDKIISILLNGGSANSDEIAIILEEAQNTRDSLAVSKTQSDRLRSELVSL
jgi:hypothetical protein